MKKSLKTVILFQTLIALCIPLYYHIMITYRLDSYVPVLIVIILVLAASRLKKRAESADEYAKKALQIADSICFKVSIVIMGIILLPFLFITGTSNQLIGCLLTWGIFALILTRTCIFLWIDKNGMGERC